jgi:serine/threonine protein kinase
MTQILLGIAITFFFAQLIAVIRPYNDKRANRMRITADVALFFTLQCVAALHGGAMDDCEMLTPNDVGWLLIGINFVVLALAAAVELIRRCFRMYSEAQLVGISYASQKPLGETTGGTHSMVCHGQYKATISTPAVPSVVKIRDPNSRVMEIETMIMLQIVHPNVVRIFRTDEDPRKYYLATEVCDYSVTEVIERFDVDIGPPSARLEICRAVIDGINAMHVGGAIHGNVTPSNILLCNENGKRTPKLCGFSCSAPLVPSAPFTKIDTLHGTLGYQPLELILGRRLSMDVEVASGTAVDVFALGSTMCYILSGGSRPFYKEANSRYIEANILAGDNGIEDIGSLPCEAKHLLTLMLSHNPKARPPLRYISGHPLFYSDLEKAQYLGETIGNLLPGKVARAAFPFIEALEQAMDDELGPYDERDPAAGGSWARLLDPAHPVGGWGTERNAQQVSSTPTLVC